LEGKVAAEILLSGEAAGAWAVGKEPPPTVALPRTPDEAADVLGWAGELGLSVAAAGAGTRLSGSGLSGPPDLVVSAAAISNVLHYEPADMTLSAGAGVTGGRLSEITSAHGQTLPLNPMGWAGSTLGGLFSRGEAGDSQTLYGRVRDLALGLTLVTGDGRVLRVGGQVVKNVAGFDLVRLAVGSRGSLGLVAEVSARLFPIPERDELLWVGFETEEDLAGCAGIVREAPFPLAGAEARWSWAFGAGGPGMLLRLQGNREAVEEMLASLRRAMESRSPRKLGDGERVAAVREMEGASRPAGSPPLPALLALSGLPADVGATLALAGELPVDKGRTALFPLIGEVRVSLRGDPGVEDRLRDVGARLAARGGAIHVLHGPAAFHRIARECVPEDGARRLSDGLRTLFDPRGTLMPGAGKEAE
jgi:FAD/FMN-containing dehydrogenase